MDIDSDIMTQKAMQYLAREAASTTAPVTDYSPLFPIILAVVVIIVILLFRMFRKY